MTHAEADIAARASPHDPVAGAGLGALIRRPDAQVGGLTGVIVVATILLAVAVPDALHSTRPTGPWAFVVVTVLFGVFEYKVFNVEFGREGIAFSLSEVPLAFALVFLSPLAAIVARALLSLPALAFFRRNRGVKLAFNSALFMFEILFAFVLQRGLIDWFGPSESVLIVSVAVAVAATSLTTSIVISFAISRYEGSLRERVVDELSASWWLYPFNSVVPAMSIALALIDPPLALIAAVPVGGTWYVINSFGKQKQALRDLDTLHGFTGRIGASLDVGEIASVAVDEVGQQTRAAGVALVRFGPDGPVVTSSGVVPLSLPTSSDDHRWRSLLSTPSVAPVPPVRLRGLGLAAPDTMPPASLIAPLVDQGEMFGVLVVTERPIIGTEFGPDDAVRLQSVADQLAVSLRRGMLHERLEYEARHDALTDLPARRLFERYVSEAVARRHDGIWVVMMLDLDRFKEVNDTLGHHAGDDLLVQFSRRMSDLLGPDDRLARLAGDEFAILCHRRTHEEIVDMAQACLREGGRPVVLDGLEIVVTVSIGVADITDLDHDALQPMRRADIAMYNAKWQRTGVELYRDEIDRRTPARLSMLGDLRTAIEHDELDVVYQPKLDLSTGAVVGVEALVRWEHETRGVVAPTEFVRVAEDTGLIKDLTDLVLARGIATLRRFEECGLGLGLAVNLSTHDLFDGRLPRRVEEYLQLNGVSPQLLTLEITESSLLVDAPRTRATIDELHAVGLRLAVDDFGTGYSSLSYLRRLPVHELKIDQSFVSGMVADPQDEVIVRSTVDLGHNLGLKVVAEGVENRAVLHRLREFGCDVAQGYGISPPMSSDDLIAWISEVRAGSGPPMWWIASAV